ncbi:S-adenosyl-L-methionine-dependent methyltransferase, partial [Mycotypha africana]|uniref:S-adenosyl-L-methionine-dependent methyltransferase n=1 Tax=Mycotypha africana TaxID=64632 RepID=UPI0023007FAD
QQHYVLKYVLGGNLHVPVPSDHFTLLDSACGVGIWTLDMAQAFPHATIIGLDTFPYTSADDTSSHLQTATIHTAALNAPNIVYKNGDLFSRLSLPANYLDIIFQRDTTAIIPQERWTFLLYEYFRILKPGGSIELVEYDFDIRDPGPVLALVNEWYQIAASSVGVDPNQAKKLKDELISAGFDNVQAQVVSIPIGEWSEDKEEREKGFLYKQVIRALFKSMRPWWILELGVSEEEYDRIINAAMIEFEEQCCYIDWIIYTANKPIDIHPAETQNKNDHEEDEPNSSHPTVDPLSFQ